LNRITEGAPATIALKGEFFNPLGSVKDRIGYAISLLTPRLATLASISANSDKPPCLGHGNDPETHHDLSRAGLPEPTARVGI
jgi:hypothetical protein